jgi:hypothetical protein
MFTFESIATPPLRMLEPHGQHLLALLGKPGSRSDVPGILLPEELDAAIARLEAAIAQERQLHAEKANATRHAEPYAEEDHATPREAADPLEPLEPLDPPEPVIGLAQRARPLINMLRRAQQADKAVVWGVAAMSPRR